MAGRFCIASLIACVALTAHLPPAMGQSGCGTTTPPGQSEIDQYFETVPGACGNESPGGGSGGSSQGGGGGTPTTNPGGEGTIPPETLEALESAGADGRAAARFAQAYGPATGDLGGSLGDSGSDGSAGDTGSSGIAAVIDTLSEDGEGLGVLLPLILAAVAVAGVAFVAVRRRAGSPG